jgi:hypothetical protein
MALNLSALMDRFKTNVKAMPEMARQTIQTAESQRQNKEVSAKLREVNKAALNFQPVKDLIGQTTNNLKNISTNLPRPLEKTVNINVNTSALANFRNKVQGFITPIKEVRQDAQIIYNRLSSRGTNEDEIKKQIQTMMNKKYTELGLTPPLNSKINFDNGIVGVESGATFDLTGVVGSMENISKNVIREIAKSKVAKDIFSKLEKIGVKASDELVSKLVKTTKPIEVEGLLKNVKTDALKTENITTSISKAKASGQSFDEWVKGQGKSVYHGGTPYDATRVEEGGISTTKDKFWAETFASGRGGGNFNDKNGSINELVISKNAKILPDNKIPDRFFEDGTVDLGGISDYAIKKGYDGVDLSANLEGEIRIFNKDVIKTKSQLKAEWDKVVDDTFLDDVAKILSDDEYYDPIIRNESKNITKSQEWENIKIELQSSQAGSRYSIPQETGGGRDYFGESSTFPDFVPSELRSSDLIEKTISKLESNKTLGDKEQRLADSISEEILKRQQNNTYSNWSGDKMPALIQGDTFVLGQSKFTTPTQKELRENLKNEIKATKQEIKNAEIAQQKATKLDAKQQKIRQEAIQNIQKHTRGNTENSIAQFKKRGLSDEDIENIILEDGTKLVDTVKIKRNADGSLSSVIKKSDIAEIKSKYSDEIPKQKWEKKSMLVEGIEIPIKAAKSIELPYAFFERKGLSNIYDRVIQSGRDAEVLKSRFIQKFKDAGLFKEGGWFTADRFNLSKNEADGVAKYYLSRQGKGKEISITELSQKGRKFVEIFDSIIKETEERFFEVAKKLGKNPGKVENYAPLMTADDIKLIDQGGSMDWLFRNHPAFFSLKERAKQVPLELYEKDYRRVAIRWMDSITQFLNYGETTNDIKYLVNSDDFKNIIKEQDWQTISDWLRNITTPESPSSLGGQSLNALSRLLRKGVALGSLGLNYASVLKQALTQVPILVIEKTLPKFKSNYAKAFGINVADLPSLTKRRGDIAISDLQGKIGRIFTGALTQFDKKNAQISLNALLDKEYNKFLKEGVEISPEIQKVIEKKAQDTLDMWYGGFFKGQRPEAFRKELGNFILMFLYPLTSQLNGFYRHIATSKGFGGTAKATAEVLAAVTAIAYMEQAIENLTFEWSDAKGMAKDVLLSMSGNIPIIGNIAYSIANETEFTISPALGNISNILINLGKGENEKVLWSLASTLGLPKQIKRINEGMQIMEDGRITDNDGKMLAPVQDTMELVRSFLRGKYGSIAAQDWVRNIGEKSEDRRWFVPQVEFLQNGDYGRKAQLYRQFSVEEQKELRGYLSEEQQKKLDKALNEKGQAKSLSDIFNNRRSLDSIFSK